MVGYPRAVPWERWRGTLKGSVLVPAGTPFGTGSDRVRGRELRKAVRIPGYARSEAIAGRVGVPSGGGGVEGLFYFLIAVALRTEVADRCVKLNIAKTTTARRRNRTDETQKTETRAKSGYQQYSPEQALYTALNRVLATLRASRTLDPSCFSKL